VIYVFKIIAKYSLITHSMIILCEIVQFVEALNTRGTHLIETHPMYRTIRNIIINMNTIPIGIPYWSLFDERPVLERLLKDTAYPIPYFDEPTECFVFKDINEAVYGCEDCLKFALVEFPENPTIQNRCVMFQRAIQLMNNNSTDIDDICKMFNVL